MPEHAVHTQDFHQEFESELLTLFRRRFLWFLGIVGFIYAMALLVTIFGVAALAVGVSREVATQQLASIRGGYWGLMLLAALVGLDVCVFVWFAGQALSKRNSRPRLLRLTQQFFIFRGVADLALAYIMRGEGFPWYTGLYHILACAFLPWTPMQALRPLFVLVPLHAITLFASQKHGWVTDLFWTLFAVFMALPGLTIAWLKTSRRAGDFKMRFLQSRYGQMRRELVDARRIHEALFPQPISDGPLSFSYCYEPMRQIGGDYLYARACPPPMDSRDGGGAGAFNILLIDVTGHGIAAALTVNRVYGEVERLFAEDPNASPAEVLAALNRYVNLTLARHSIFATALCLRIDIDRNTVEYSSGGHPPAFLCTEDGRITELGSTSFVLGAVGPADFEPDSRTLAFLPGDSIIAYTDGAIEARNPEGRMLGVFGFQKALASFLSGRHDLAGRLLTMVEQHRAGPPEDDTLLVEITRRAHSISVHEAHTHARVATDAAAVPVSAG